jgi:glycosyltransferase involved in cell wall biosynthesis
MAKALLLSYWNVSDPAFGGGRRINALIDALPGQVVLCQPGSPHPACESVTYRTDFGRRKRGINWGMFNFLWPANARLVRSLVERRRPPVIIMTSMWNYFPLRALKGVPIVLDAHDVNAIAVGERLGDRHPFTCLVRAWEAYVVRRIDHLFVCSPRDREQFMARYGLAPDRVTVAPNGVTLRPRPPPSDAPGDRPCTLFFMGKLDYQPNAEGLAFLDSRVMPELERRAPGRFRLVVTGGPVPARPLHPSISCLGVLPDAELRQTLQRADLCLAPIFSGSGTRVKILEYMAAARPVLSTAKGAEGLGCVDGEHLQLAEPDAFAEAILALAQDPARRQRIGEAAWDHVRRNFDWTQAVHVRWHAVLNRWLPPPPAASAPETP